SAGPNGPRLRRRHPGTPRRRDRREPRPVWRGFRLAAPGKSKTACSRAEAGQMARIGRLTFHGSTPPREESPSLLRTGMAGKAGDWPARARPLPCDIRRGVYTWDLPRRVPAHALVRAAEEASPGGRGHDHQRIRRDAVATDDGDMKKATR